MFKSSKLVILFCLLLL